MTIIIKKTTEDLKKQEPSIISNWWYSKRIIITENDEFRRNNLLKNAEYGLGKVEQIGKNLLYTVGSEEHGFTEYLIINASLPETNKNETN